MRIGKLDAPYTAISSSDATTITVRGRDLCKDLIGKIDFVDYFFLLLMGRPPTEDQRYFVNALLVAIAEHGLVPSVQTARMTLAASPEALQGAVAAGLLGAGSVILGSAEAAGRLLYDLVATSQDQNRTEIVVERLQNMRMAKHLIPGFGHPQHSSGDPRAETLLRIAKDRGLNGPYLTMLETIAQALPHVFGRSLPININGVIPAILLEIGFPVTALKSISILARTAGLLAHLQEETSVPIGFILSHAAAEAIAYNGEKAPD